MAFDRDEIPLYEKVCGEARTSCSRFPHSHATPKEKKPFKKATRLYSLIQWTLGLLYFASRYRGKFQRLTCSQAPDSAMDIIIVVARSETKSCWLRDPEIGKKNKGDIQFNFDSISSYCTDLISAKGFFQDGLYARELLQILDNTHSKDRIGLKERESPCEKK
ncbi:hypothetical protein KQX54_020771 [Cotesia glomerata]|uniref:Uncharacterized protein n=1 Tax=Cotesia glomerata TaxID=32391 RepID=A0AAV7I1U3_COTGL|nr:hypothetical protein KQX54_020771 [Cotesia glomerata]